MINHNLKTDREELFPPDAINRFRGHIFYIITAAFFVVDAVQIFATQPMAPGITVARLCGGIALLIFAVAPIIYKITGQLRSVSVIVLISAFCAIFFAALSHGGAPAPTMAFFALIPLGATVLLGRNAGAMSLLIVVAAILYCGYAGAAEGSHATPHTEFELSILFTSAALLGVVAVASVALSYEALVIRAIKQVKESNKKLRVASKELSEREEFLTAVMETVHDGIAATNMSGKLTVLNRAARESHGGDHRPESPSEWQQVFSVFKVDGKTPVEEHEMPLLRALNGEHITDEHLIIAPNEKPKRRISVSAAPIVGVDQKIKGAVCTSKDITIEHEQRDEIRRQNMELDQFARVASHDLQAPLRGIINLTDKLSETIEDVSPALGNDLMKIGRSAEKMRALIKDVLYMSRLSGGQIALQPVSPRDCIEAALDLAGIDENDETIDFNFKRIGEVSSDPRGLTQIYLNLISNALKFCRDGIAPKIEFTCEIDGESLILGVRDNGIGIPEGGAERIFMPTERLHTELEYEGTGLGLAICRNALTKMGGEIWVESNPDQGSHFRFRLSAFERRNALAS